MATTVGGFSAIDDTEVDAESPITETLITRLRDNSYWIDAGTKQTTITDTSKVLKPDGSGGVEWGSASATVSSSSGTVSTSSGSPSQIAITSLNNVDLRVYSDFSGSLYNFNIIVKGSDSTSELFTRFQNGSSGQSLALTTSFQGINFAENGSGANGTIYVRVTGGNLEFYVGAAGSPASKFVALTL